MNNRFLNAKRSYITRNIDLKHADQLVQKIPESGDLILARVDRLRQHTRLEDIHGRRVHMYPGDEILVVAGDRYATDQFHARVPEQLGPCHLVAAGGLAADVINKNRGIKPATEITALGVVADQRGRPLNLKAFAPLTATSESIASKEIPVLLVMGSDMNSGKTTLACAAVNGFKAAGYKVTAAKLTGTGAGPDYWRMHDAGADQVIDFVDAGFPSTVGLNPEQMLTLLRQFHTAAQQNRSDLLVIEVADGVLQKENQQLLRSEAFISQVNAALIAADGSLAATMATQTVLQAGIPVLGIGGVISRSPLSCDEARGSLGLPVLNLSEFHTPDIRDYLLGNLFGAEQYAAAYSS